MGKLSYNADQTNAINFKIVMEKNIGSTKVGINNGLSPTPDKLSYLQRVGWHQSCFSRVAKSSQSYVAIHPASFVWDACLSQRNK